MKVPGLVAGDSSLKEAFYIIRQDSREQEPKKFLFQGKKRSFLRVQSIALLGWSGRSWFQRSGVQKTTVRDYENVFLEL